MDDGLKKRLIGAIVLVCVAVILIPMFFDEDEGESEEFIVAPLPPSPAFSKIQIAPPMKPEIAVSPMTEPLEPKAEDSVAKSHRQAAPAKPSKQPLEKGWVVQMGAFKEQKNAESLRDRLRAANHKAYIQHRPNHMPALYRVYVGPKIQRREIELLHAKLLKQDYQLGDIKIMRYSPR